MSNTENDSIVWEEPEAKSVPSGTDWSRIAEALKARPGEWAVVREFETVRQANTMARNVRGGLLKPFGPRGAFEAVLRGKKTYARFVGGES